MNNNKNRLQQKFGLCPNWEHILDPTCLNWKERGRFSERGRLLRGNTLSGAQKFQVMFLFSSQSNDPSICQSTVHQPISGVLVYPHAVYWTLYLTQSPLLLHDSGIICCKDRKMEATSKAEKQPRSSFGALHKVLIFLVVLAICAGFFVGLELFRRRLNALEKTVNGLSEDCKNAHQGMLLFLFYAWVVKCYIALCFVKNYEVCELQQVGQNSLSVGNVSVVFTNTANSTWLAYCLSVHSLLQLARKRSSPSFSLKERLCHDMLSHFFDGLSCGSSVGKP